MIQLRNKTALVTGASRGLGPHIVAALAREGVNLIIAARDKAALEQVQSQIRREGVDVRSIPTDLRDPAQTERLAKEASDIDILVNNAAIERAIPFDRADISEIEEMTRVNLVAPMILTRLLLPQLIAKPEGHIVNISSLAGLVGTPYEETYAATKHGLVGFSRSLGLTLKSEGHRVGVSVICPAFVQDAGMYHDASIKTGGIAPRMIGTVPMRRLAAAVLNAIRKNQPEIILTGMPMRPFLLTQTISPKLAGRMSFLVGVPQMFKKWTSQAAS